MNTYKLLIVDDEQDMRTLIRSFWLQKVTRCSKPPTAQKR